MTQSRRSFLAQSSVFATFAISGTKSSAKIIGANDRINVAVCGIKGRGNSHMGGLGRQKNVEISHLGGSRLPAFRRQKQLRKKKIREHPRMRAGRTRGYWRTVRSMLISIATPNHWHSLMSIWACQAGKDVYVEKPLSHNLFEGRKLGGKRQRNTGGSFSTAPKTVRLASGPTWPRKLPRVNGVNSKWLWEPAIVDETPLASRKPRPRQANSISMFGPDRLRRGLS